MKNDRFPISAVPVLAFALVLTHADELTAVTTGLTFTQRFEEMQILAVSDMVADGPIAAHKPHIAGLPSPA